MSEFNVEKLNEGEGPTVPKGCKVRVHYTGKLADGTVFDSTVERNEPCEFVIGVGRVIKGWDEGITQLQAGQKAILTCPPDYAYGADGIPPTIPPNATLTFEVEVLAILKQLVDPAILEAALLRKRQEEEKTEQPAA